MMDRLALLERENADLRERLAYLEGALGGGLRLPAAWALSPSQEKLVAVLLCRSFVSRDAAMAAVYRDTGRDEPSEKIVDVMIYHVRKKLKPHGIEIRTAVARGYCIDEPLRSRLRKALASDDSAEPRGASFALSEGAFA